MGGTERALNRVFFLKKKNALFSGGARTEEKRCPAYVFLILTHEPRGFCWNFRALEFVDIFFGGESRVFEWLCAKLNNSDVSRTEPRTRWNE